MKKPKPIKRTDSSVSLQLTAKQFIEALSLLKSKPALETVQRFFRETDDNKSEFWGVRMGDIFALAKKFLGMPLVEIEKLLKSPVYEARVGAVSIMDFQARDKKITPERKKDLFDLYIRRHDRINNWDMVDRSAP